ncbi:uncharacterized protein [Blastocystis hominis]|uniref:diacylglycerol O-acyltransferase n=1 Tax=Blastocystis hominis TaxID=12968 RepID=D8M9N4_BLAHO|nr:uncharacterized protein [Blastocystis hominis]CBK24773.2 unnamed protein product [Blastocystis hominis]|eukprot:XP_012898821.1 uncharacterized protein [Blastocystis hominis]
MYVFAVEIVSLLSAIILLCQGALYKRNIQDHRNLIMYKLLKLSIFVFFFFPIAHAFHFLIPFILLYFISFMKDPELHTGRPSRWFYNLPIWKKIAAAKNSSIVRTTILPPGSYIFAAHPHGVLPFGICLNIGTNASDIHILFPRILFRGVALLAERIAAPPRSIVFSKMAAQRSYYQEVQMNHY